MRVLTLSSRLCGLVFLIVCSASFSHRELTPESDKKDEKSFSQERTEGRIKVMAMSAMNDNERAILLLLLPGA